MVVDSWAAIRGRVRLGWETGERERVKSTKSVIELKSIGQRERLRANKVEEGTEMVQREGSISSMDERGALTQNIIVGKIRIAQKRDWEGYFFQKNWLKHSWIPPVPKIASFFLPLTQNWAKWYICGVQCGR